MSKVVSGTRSVLKDAGVKCAHPCCDQRKDCLYLLNMNILVHFISTDLHASFSHHLRVFANPAPITYPSLRPTCGVNQISKIKSNPGYASV